MDALTYRIPETVLLTGAMVKTLNNILFLVNGPSEEMRTVSLWGKCEPTEGRLFKKKGSLYIEIMAGMVQRVELTATSVSAKFTSVSYYFHIYFIREHCLYYSRVPSVFPYSHCCAKQHVHTSEQQAAVIGWEQQGGKSQCFVIGSSSSLTETRNATVGS